MSLTKVSENLVRNIVTDAQLEGKTRFQHKLQTWSEDFENILVWRWLRTPIITSNVAVAPDGTSTASTIKAKYPKS